MRASLLIAAHNEGEALWKTIRSCVEASAGLDHEIIVADDASTDGSVEETRRRFPQVRLVSFPDRRGASPTKHLAGEHARGEVLIFLDGHTNSEGISLLRLVEDVEALDGNALVTPAVPHLDPVRWLNSRTQIGHGYSFRLDTLECGWVPLNRMTPRDVGRRRLYESPALIGCALAIGRGLYQELWGFDAAMRSWGVEDIDFGLKAWLLGYPILHDPQAIVGHRFRQAFDNYDVPPADLLANQLRFARKHFTSAVWSQWVEACRLRNQGPLPGHPEGLWARAWSVFEESRISVEQERQYLHSRRTRDEFEYAATWGLDWPGLAGEGGGSIAATVAEPAAVAQLLQVEPSPSPPPPPCNLTAIDPNKAVVCVNFEKTFTAVGANVDDVEWASSGATPATGKGSEYSTKWAAPTSDVLVGARCNPDETGVRANVTVLSLSFDQSPIITGYIKDPDDPVDDEPLYQNCVLTVQPPECVIGIGLEQVGEPKRVEINITRRDALTGEVFFTVGGKIQTPRNQEEGDTIRVLYNGDPIEGECGEVKVKVVRPWEIGEPHPEDSGVVTPVNQVADATTSPAYIGDDLGPDQVKLWTIYTQWLTIPVDDQFGDRLNDIYAGAQVEEMAGMKWYPINQEMRSDGTYLDPVFKAEPKDPGPSIVDRGPLSDSWPGEAKEDLVASFTQQNIPVRIGGHQLQDGIERRNVVAVPPSTIDIEW